MVTSISALICTSLLFISFRKKMGAFGLKDIVVSGIKIIGVSFVMGIAVKLVNKILVHM